MPKKSPEERLPIQLEVDDKGDVILRPLTGWSIGSLAQLGVLLAMHYAESEQDIETGNCKSIQFSMKPDICIELCEALTRMAKELGAGSKPHGRSVQ